MKDFLVYVHGLKNHIQKLKLEGLPADDSLQKQILDLIDKQEVYCAMIFQEGYSRGIEDGMIVGRAQARKDLGQPGKFSAVESSH